MAKADSPIAITGSYNDYSLYKMRGVDKVIFRKKGGPTGADIKTKKKYVNVRRNMAEFGAASRAGAALRQAIRPVTHVADPFFAGKMSALAGSICKLDDTNDWGERRILFSKNRNLLEGLNLNSKLVFNSLMRQPLICEFDREKGNAVVKIPDLVPALNFYLPSQYPLYQLTVSLGVITDFGFINEKHGPVSNKNYATELYRTEWHASRSNRLAEEIELQLSGFTKLEEGQCMILAMAIDFGYPTEGGQADRIKYAGSGMLLGMG